MRSNAEVESDLAKISEADYWIGRSGHTGKNEIENYNLARSRLIKDFEDELFSGLLEGDRAAQIARLKYLYQLNRNENNKNHQTGDGRFRVS